MGARSSSPVIFVMRVACAASNAAMYSGKDDGGLAAGSVTGADVLDGAAHLTGVWLSVHPPPPAMNYIPRV